MIIWTERRFDECNVLISDYWIFATANDANVRCRCTWCSSTSTRTSPPTWRSVLHRDSVKIESRSVETSFISFHIISDEKQHLSYNTTSYYSSSLHQIISDERRQITSLNFSIYNVSTKQFQCKRNNSKLISLALYSLKFLKAEIFLQQWNFCCSVYLLVFIIVRNLLYTDSVLLQSI